MKKSGRALAFNRINYIKEKRSVKKRWNLRSYRELLQRY